MAQKGLPQRELSKTNDAFSYLERRPHMADSYNLESPDNIILQHFLCVVAPECPLGPSYFVTDVHYSGYLLCKNYSSEPLFFMSLYVGREVGLFDPFSSLYDRFPPTSDLRLFDVTGAYSITFCVFGQYRVVFFRCVFDLFLIIFRWVLGQFQIIRLRFAVGACLLPVQLCLLCIAAYLCLIELIYTFKTRNPNPIRKRNVVDPHTTLRPNWRAVFFELDP